MASVLESVDDDAIINILHYATPGAAARLALTSQTMRRKIFCNDRLWKTYSIRRWGRGVESETGEDGDNDAHPSIHYRYFRHRSSSGRRCKERSHLDLIQETYADCPYRLLTACILCSRTSGGPTIRKVVHDFLAKYSSPTAVIDADMSTMAAELHALGLNRERTMKRFAHDFLGGWSDVTELHGCGAFAASSFAVFCRGDYQTVLRDKKADKNVKAYAAFYKRTLEPKKEGEEDELERQSKKKAKPGKKRKAPKETNAAPVRRSTRSRTQEKKKR